MSRFAWFVLLTLTAVLARAAEGIAATNPEAIQAFLNENFVRTNAAIVVGLIDQNGSQILTAGKLDNGSANAVNGDSLFFIGSVSKTFTALLLQEMADRGEVALDDPVAKYLPDSVRVPTFEGKQITLLDLATHASGLPMNPDNMRGKNEREQYETYTVDQMYEFLATYKLAGPPGKEFSYSNAGFALLGHALARKAGKNFEELLIERVCRPVGLSDTCISLSDEQKTRLAMGHEADGTPSTPWKFTAYQPAGNIQSSANDLLKYAAAQVGLKNSPLTPAMKKTHVVRFEHGEMPKEDLGYGVFGRTAMDWVDRDAYQPPGMDLLGHAGGAGSYHAFVGLDLKQRRGVVVLTTGNDFATEAIGWTILQQLPLTRESAKMFARNLVGIGAALELVANPPALRVTKVYRNSPAESAGLPVGSSIRKIDNNSLEGKKLADCMALLRGTAGTNVRLDLVDAEGAEKVVEVTRHKFVLEN
jgi:serine-type D-Ala-D-Ala carboxypeptidase/endopeptidase